MNKCKNCIKSNFYAAPNDEGEFEVIYTCQNDKICIHEDDD